MKRLLAIIGCAILLALVCVQLYSRHVDPDTQFFLRAAAASDSWAEQIHAAERPVIVLTGGSEARSGVDPQLMLDEFGIPLVNAAGAAGHGLQANAAAAFKYLKPGDTLVLSILSTNDTNILPSASGVKINVYRQGLSAFDSGVIEPGLENAGKFLSSDVRAMFVLVTRYFGRAKRLYKYNEQTVVHASGWMEIQYREMDKYKLAAPKTSERLAPLTEDSEFMQTLQRLQEYCRSRGIRFLVSIPVECVHEGMRPEHAMKVLCISRLGIPVLKDERLGCLPTPTDFADMRAHLNAKGAADNTRLLARLLRDNIFWTEEELVAALHSMGWNADGTPTNQQAIP
ncbi:MAG: hypothetical protein Q4E43_06200 [Akkermansia sp.]|nr:hypothetical protein [Akkermansia sp.]